MDDSMQCIMCGKYSGSGINILNRFICGDCEKAMVNMDINDVRYEQYKTMIKEKIYDGIILQDKIR